VVAPARSLEGTQARSASARRRRIRQNIEGWLFIAPIMIGILAFYVLPILTSLYQSFTNADGFTPARWVGLANYERMFTRDRFFTDSVVNTLYYVLGHIPLTIGAALGLALLCNRKMRGVTLFRTAYFIPVITNVVAISLVWNYFYLPRIGVLNSLLALIGVNGPAWLDDPRWAMFSVIVVSVWFSVGFPMMILLAGLQNVPEILYDAARVDGAASWARFRYVTLPLLTPSIFFLTITQFISSFQVFGIIYVLTSGGPGNATAVYIFYLFQNAFQQSRMGYASAMAWVLFIVIASITMLQWKLQKHWVVYD
jgi:multiple sugar transport system permease protein